MLFAVNAQAKKATLIRQDIPLSRTQQEIADLAFDYWLSLHFQDNGSPEECYLRAVLEVTFREKQRNVDTTPPEAA